MNRELPQKYQENNSKPSTGLNVLCVNSDLAGCYHYRVKVPFGELKRFGVTYNWVPFLPNSLNMSFMDTLIRFIHPYDVVNVQRCYKYPLINALRQACDIMGKPLIFETDDDYLNLPPYNPCSVEMKTEDAREGFKEILRMADMVTVTTEELKNIYYPFNKNIKILPNNLENVHQYRDFIEGTADKDGKFKIEPTLGLYSIPSVIKGGGKRERIIRIGYSGTPTHQIDFKTIEFYWWKLLKKYKKKICVVYIGDQYFAQLHQENMKGEGVNSVFIPTMMYELYYLNLRNLDIGIAPLMPNIFNMSKSPIKAVEYGSWGIPSVLPNYITYNREFTDGKDCLMYHSGQEFYDAMSELIENEILRERLGENAREYVLQNRLEHLYSEERFNIYKDVVGNSHQLRIFNPTKEINNEIPQAN